MLENLRISRKAVGIKQCTKAIESGSAKAVFLAKDADERVVSNLKALCQRNSIEVIHVDTMKQLGKACGIEVGAAVACLLK